MLIEESDNFVAVENFLAHHGIKGMKWGVRKFSAVGFVRNVNPDDNNSPIITVVDRGKPKQIRKLEVTTHNIKTHLLDPNTGPFSKNGEVTKFNVATTADFKRRGLDVNKMSPEARAVYNKNIIDIMTKEAEKHAPLGTKVAFNFHPHNGQLYLLVGNKKNVKKFVGMLQHSDESDLVQKFMLVTNPFGLIIGLQAIGEPETLKHSAEVENFLAHHGIKGMKWGIRKNSGSSGSGTSAGGGSHAISGVGNPNSYAQAKMHAAKTGDVITLRRKRNGEAVHVQKQADGTWTMVDVGVKSHASADQQRHDHTLNKPVHEMSTQEIKAANERKKQVNDYNKLFAPTHNANLKAQVDHLDLQKKYNQLQKDLTPEKKSATDNLIERVTQGYKTYTAIDGILGGNLSKKITRTLGLEPPLSEKQKLDAETELLKSLKANHVAKRDVNEYKALHAYAIAGDSPSLAKGVVGGKHALRTGKHQIVGL